MPKKKSKKIKKNGKNVGGKADVHAHEEGHLDVRPHVVLTDQTVFAISRDQDSLDGQVHHVCFLNHGNDDHPATSDHLQPAETGFDDRLLWSRLPVEARNRDERSYNEEHRNNEPD